MHWTTEQYFPTKKVVEQMHYNMQNEIPPPSSRSTHTEILQQQLEVDQIAIFAILTFSGFGY